MKSSIQANKPLLKLPAVLIRFKATVSVELAKTLHNVFASLPENVGSWLFTGVSVAGVSFVELRKDLVCVGIDEIDVYGGNWTVRITRNSRRWVIHNPETREWIVCFPGGSNGAARKLYQAIVWRDDVEITEIR